MALLQEQVDSQCSKSGLLVLDPMGLLGRLQETAAQTSTEVLPDSGSSFGPRALILEPTRLQTPH